MGKSKRDDSELAKSSGNILSQSKNHGNSEYYASVKDSTLKKNNRDVIKLNTEKDVQ